MSANLIGKLQQAVHLFLVLTTHDVPRPVEALSAGDDDDDDVVEDDEEDEEEVDLSGSTEASIDSVATVSTSAAAAEEGSK